MERGNTDLEPGLCKILSNYDSNAGFAGIASNEKIIRLPLNSTVVTQRLFRTGMKTSCRDIKLSTPPKSTSLINLGAELSLNYSSSSCIREE